MIHTMHASRPFPHIWIFDWVHVTRNVPDWWFDRTAECRYLTTHGPYMVAILKKEIPR